MNEPLRRLAVAAYVVALVFIVTGGADALTNMWPWNWGDEQWRYGFAGVSSGYLIQPLFGLFLVLVTAAAAQHRLLLRVMSIVTLVVAVITLVWAIGFVLDVLQLQGRVNDDMAESFRIGSAKTLCKLGLATLTLLVMGVCGLRSVKALSPSR